MFVLFIDIPTAQCLPLAARDVGPARPRGGLYDLEPFPGLKPARRTREWVCGDLYAVRDPFVVRALDRYEAGTGAGRPRFVRSACVVSVGRCRQGAVWVYMYRRNPSHRARITHGDYRAHRRPR